jgi:hypothetical protein
MSEVHIEDPAWVAIMADERLSGARRKLSFHEIRLIIDHARNAGCPLCTGRSTFKSVDEFCPEHRRLYDSTGAA